MTTKVTVDAHAGWPVEVYMIDTLSGAISQETSKVLVQPGEVRDFYVHDSREIRVKEIGKPADPPPTSE